MNKKLFWKCLRRAAIISIIVGVVGVTIIYARGIEDNPEAVAWATIILDFKGIHRR